MSKIGQAPITVPSSITVVIADQSVTVTGKNGTLIHHLPVQLNAEKNGDKLTIRRTDDRKKTKALHGLYRNLIRNAIIGVDEYFTKRLEIVGTGYTVKMQGEDLQLKVGYSHPVIFKKAEGVQFKVEGNNKIVVMGIDKQLVGQVAYQIKMIKKPDVYKGKGVRYEGEQLRIKPGKKVKAAGAA